MAEHAPVAAFLLLFILLLSSGLTGTHEKLRAVETLADELPLLHYNETSSKRASFRTLWKGSAKDRTSRKVCGPDQFQQEHPRLPGGRKANTCYATRCHRFVLWRELIFAQV